MNRWAQAQAPAQPQALPVKSPGAEPAPHLTAGFCNDRWENLSCPRTPHASAGQTWEEGQACSGTWLFPEGPAELTCFPHCHSGPSGHSCGPAPTGWRAQPYSAAFVLGKLSLRGGG